MAPWDKYKQAPAPTKGAAPWAKYEAPKDKSYVGSILPISVDAEGNKHFDSNAGILGSLKDAFMLPGDAMSGKVDPTSEEGIARAFNFAGAFSPVNPGVRSGDRAIPGILRASEQAPVAVPTAEALKAAGDEGYKQMRNMGVDYDANAVKTLAETLRAGLDEKGFIPEVSPKTSAVLDKLANPPEGSVAPLSGLESARQSFTKIGQDFLNPQDRTSAKIVREGIDKFIQNADPESVVAGPAAEAGQVLRDARANTAAFKRSADLSKATYAADLSASAANSGQNFGNALRQKAKSILLSDKAKSGFNAEELDALESVVRGTPTANATRFVGNLLGGGGGLGSVVTSGAGGMAGIASGSPALAALGAFTPALGFASKKVSNALTEGGLRVVDEMTRARSPLYQALLQNAPRRVAAPEKRAALLRALLLAQRAENGQ